MCPSAPMLPLPPTSCFSSICALCHLDPLTPLFLITSYPLPYPPRPLHIHHLHPHHLHPHHLNYPFHPYLHFWQVCTFATSSLYYSPLALCLPYILFLSTPIFHLIISLLIPLFSIHSSLHCKNPSSLYSVLISPLSLFGYLFP